MLLHALLIFLGGGLGCVCRWVIATSMQNVFGEWLSYGTLAVNAIGCFAAGMVVHSLGEHLEIRADHSAFLVVGFLAGFTTFSSFARETLELMMDGHLTRAAMHVGLMNILCIGGVIAGFALSRMICPDR